MSLKRFLTAIIGLPLIILMLIFANKYVIDAILMIVTFICMDEYFHVIKEVCNPIKWIGYLSTVLVFLVAFLEIQQMMMVMIYSVPVILLILFLHIILTDMRINFKDVAFTFLGIFYVTYFMVFLSLVTGLHNGKAYLGYGLAAAWGTDVYAFVIGMKFGKHHFSKVSPKKSIEGSIGGIIGAIIMSLIFVYGATFFTTFEPIQDKLYIYTDVDGVYSDDPNTNNNAIKYDTISYDKMIEMAKNGAKVLHSKCVKIAKQNNIPIIVKSTFVENEGTIVQ